MKILFLTRGVSKRGGCIVLTTLTRELRKRGHAVELVAFKRSSDEDYPRSKFFWEDLKPTIIEIAKRESKDLQNVKYFDAASDYLKKNSRKFDRVIVDSWFALVAAIKSDMINDNFFQLVQSDPEFRPENQSKIMKAELFSLLPRFNIQRIVVADIIRKMFKERYSQTTKSIQLFVRDEFFDADYKIRNRENLMLVCSTATFNMPEKGLDFLLEVLNEFSKENKFELTLITGDPIKKKNLDGFNFGVKEETAEDTSEMVRLLKKGDVYLNTSTKETFCLALAEAMAMGMPCVALDSVGNREYVNEKNAKFTQNKAGFLKGLNELLDLDERKRVSEEARKTMRKFRLEKTVKDFEKAIGVKK